MRAVGFVAGVLVLAAGSIAFLRGPTAPPPAAAAPGAGTSSPSPVELQVAGIDSARLMTHLSVLAHDSMEGRAAGAEGGARARRYLIAELTRLGLPPVHGEYERPFDLPGGGTGVNLVARVPGTEPAGIIVLSAHYDHEGIRGGQIYNGTDDNASGVAVVLEAARILRDAPSRHDVVIALFDGEESGLSGARAFVSDPDVPLSEILIDVNLDMVARTDGLLWAGGAHHTPSLRPVLERVAAEAPLELRLGHDRPGAPEGDDWTSQSDHGAFHDEGIPFVYFGVEDHADYHRPTDDFDRVDPGDFMNAARTVLLALRALDDALPLPDPDDPR